MGCLSMVIMVVIAACVGGVLAYLFALERCGKLQIIRTKDGVVREVRTLEEIMDDAEMKDERGGEIHKLANCTNGEMLYLVHSRGSYKTSERVTIMPCTSSGE